MTAAAVKLAQKDFTNLTQTLGMMTPNGRMQPLQRFYRESMDFAFEQVFTGAADYETAMRQATQKMADAGVRTIDYASGHYKAFSKEAGLPLQEERAWVAGYKKVEISRQLKVGIEKR